jgi:alkylation response protein AidB-like acyl-CoA dehydrogenase
MCKTSEKDVSCFLVEKGTPGLSFGKLEKKMGWNCSPTAQVIFDNVRVPKTNMLGKEGNGFKMAMSALDGGRINIASCSLGGSSFAFDAAKDYMHGN